MEKHLLLILLLYFSVHDKHYTVSKYPLGLISSFDINSLYRLHIIYILFLMQRWQG